MVNRRPKKISLEIPFAKYQAAGNDFIIIDHFAALELFDKWPGAQPLRADEFPALDVSLIARRICDRHAGIGADGLLVMFPSQDKKHQARLFVYNADGSRAEMSGNGIRCAAAYLLEKARRQPKSQPRNQVAKRAARVQRLELETAAGVKSMEVVKAEERRWVFRVGMGEPILQAERIPFKAGDLPSPVVGFPLETSRGILKVTVTSMGNPHCTVFVADFDSIDWADLGREIETSALFPNRTNVEFVRVIARNEIEVRFWERGVGKTQSSGTGSCAAVVAGVLNGRTSRKVRVRTLAGALDVAWPKGKEVALTGPVELIARGTYYFSNGRDR
jgi:diaminopimelate epimerase